jgi:hypothetical protein
MTLGWSRVRQEGYDRLQSWDADQRLHHANGTRVAINQKWKKKGRDKESQSERVLMVTGITLQVSWSKEMRIVSQGGQGRLARF